MYIHITQQETIVPGPTVSIDCPVCDACRVPAASCEKILAETVYWIFTRTTRATLVICSACGCELNTSLPLNSLEQYQANVLGGMLKPHVTLVQGFLAVVAVAICWTPGSGLVFALISYWVNRRINAWPRRWSRFAINISLVLSALLLVGLAFEWLSQ